MAAMESSVPVPQEQITRLLVAIRGGEESASETLIPLVYDELRGLARSRLRREGGVQTVRPTELVHEAYLRLVGDGEPEFENRAHFFGAAAKAMRRVLIDRARRRLSIRRGAGRERVPIDAALDSVPSRGDPEEVDVLGLDDALTDLERFDPRMARVVLLRTFGGLSVEDTARVLTLSERTVKREWACARAWLSDRLTDPWTPSGDPASEPDDGERA